ncbi:hypothetical protein HHK36_015107 [Tetracentron sinense]|uniref:Uncharacterized protein n=1 Tax=Tetracentron sinense TaxID=13715 RepID=A0A835DFV8_TETSI|nr:hypothetical protein HHK36_015107 [Tetracentron sinense]
MLGELFECGRASVFESGESSKIHEGEVYEDGLRVIGIGSNSDEEENEFMGIDLISANYDWLMVIWEEVAAEGEVLGMVIDAVDEAEAGEGREKLMPFGQFMENETPIRGSPPASRSVVENLTTVFLTQEDLKNNTTLCAVCKDEISMEEKATQLPCSHH